MKALLLAIAAAGSMLVAAQVNAADSAEALAQKSGCLACHSVEKKILGPAYKDVAAKYKGDKGAEAKLIAKVKAGGSGVWGPMPMPANLSAGMWFFSINCRIKSTNISRASPLSFKGNSIVSTSPITWFLALIIAMFVMY